MRQMKEHSEPGKVNGTKRLSWFNKKSFQIHWYSHKNKKTKIFFSILSEFHSGLLKCHHLEYLELNTKIILKLLKNSIWIIQESTHRPFLSVLSGTWYLRLIMIEYICFDKVIWAWSGLKYGTGTRRRVLQPDCYWPFVLTWIILVPVFITSFWNAGNRNPQNMRCANTV